MILFKDEYASFQVCEKGLSTACKGRSDLELLPCHCSGKAFTGLNVEKDREKEPNGEINRVGCGPVYESAVSWFAKNVASSDKSSSSVILSPFVLFILPENLIS